MAGKGKVENVTSPPKVRLHECEEDKHTLVKLHALGQGEIFCMIPPGEAAGEVERRRRRGPGLR